MKKLMLVLAGCSVFGLAMAQKKMVPVSHSEITGITLPVGSKKDGRILSVAGAQTLLEMETKKSNSTLSTVEVLSLPPVTTGGYNKDSLVKKLTDLGWKITAIEPDNNYAWLQKDNHFVISFFSTDKKETSLYFGLATAIPDLNQPANNTGKPQPVISQTNPIQQSPNSSVQNNADNASIFGTWGATASDQSSFRVNNGVMNYISRQYTFNANGTYIFVSKAFDPLMDKMLLGKENGTYQMNGNHITVTPQKSVLEAWNKKDGRDEWGKLINTQNLSFETISYQFTKHYFSGIKEWSLVLMNDKPTQRDGPFNGGTAFSNAWIYGTPCSQCLIKLPN